MAKKASILSLLPCSPWRSASATLRRSGRYLGSGSAAVPAAAATPTSSSPSGPVFSGVKLWQRAAGNTVFLQRQQSLPPSPGLGQQNVELLHLSRRLFSSSSDLTTQPPLRRCLVAEKAPEFCAQAVMPDGGFKEISLSALLEKKKYVCLLFYPLDFTFVCPSEIIAFHKKVQEFESRGVQLLGVSVDSHFTHLAWQKVAPREGGIGKIDFPLVSDLSKAMARNYGVLFNDSLSLRGLFLIDQSGVVRHQLVNDLPLGRSVDETLRIIDALQHTEKHGEVCPANWRKGEDAMKPSADGVASYLGRHWS